ncbi:VQ motif-containing protein 4-like [Nymphaea colorata]|uniref:VQ domain-containing protein n=1 Tax=Nymphaea colorata TaxID=210225 RepID=A0A5K0W9E5_9MAGN|nr:VQ motif-containing protein 4-like [Nymphaea colorata]
METLKSSLSAAPPPPPASALPLSPTSSSSNSSTNSNPTPPPSLPSIPKIPPKPSLILQETPPPTTFIQADPSSFKHVVQMLTGLPETAAAAAAARKQTSSASPSSSPSSTDQPPRGHLPSFKKTSSFRLYERRQKTLRKLKLSDPSFPLGATVGFSSPLSSPAASPVPLSPSTLLDLTALSLSPVTPLISDPFAAAAAAAAAEEKAIAAKGFYLHPSTPRGGESTEPPRLLPLFPVTSPRVSSPPPS